MENMDVPAEATPKGRMAQAPTIMPSGGRDAPPPAFARFAQKMYVAQQNPAPSAKATPTGMEVAGKFVNGRDQQEQAWPTASAIHRKSMRRREPSMAIASGPVNSRAHAHAQSGMRLMA